jgi:putative transposase
MKRLQAFKYELMPNGEQQHNMRRFSGSCRFVFNKALALHQTYYEEGKKKLTYADLCKQLTQRRKSSETKWLSETHSQPLQQALKDLERAYKGFVRETYLIP